MNPLLIENYESEAIIIMSLKFLICTDSLMVCVRKSRSRKPLLWPLPSSLGTHTDAVPFSRAQLMHSHVGTSPMKAGSGQGCGLQEIC